MEQRQLRAGKGPWQAQLSRPLSPTPGRGEAPFWGKTSSFASCVAPGLGERKKGRQSHRAWSGKCNAPGEIKPWESERS